MSLKGSKASRTEWRNIEDSSGQRETGVVSSL